MTKIQLKIMDIGHPLIAFYARVKALMNAENPSDLETSMDELLRGLQVALQQWGRSFAFLTKLRREAVVSLVDPRFSYLLKTVDALPTGKDARDNLLSTSFINLMLKEATNDEILKKYDKSMARRGKRYDRPGYGISVSRGGYGHQQQSASGSHPYDHVGDAQPYSSGGQGRGKNSDRRYVSNVSVNVSVPISNPPEELKIDARVATFASNWLMITDDPWVIETVSNGLRLDFLSAPFQSSFPKSVAMSEDMKTVCDLEVKNLIAKNAITEITGNGSDGFISSFFCVSKRDGSWRPIVNLKPLNSFIRYEHFKMENLESVRFLARKGDWFVKVDLKDAYLSIPVHKSHKKYLRFLWRGRCFEFRCMAFGLSPAPRIFTKILKVVVAFLRKKGLRLIIYLDDLLLFHEAKEGLVAATKTTVDLFTFLGFVINREKSILEPCQRIEYLGLLID